MDGDWTDHAACRDHDPDLWFPEKWGDQYAAAAIAVCAGCGVAEECDAAARRIPWTQRWGIWAGVRYSPARGTEREPGRCPLGHDRNGSKHCTECSLLTTRAAIAMGVPRREFINAFGSSGRVAQAVLVDLEVTV